MKGLVVVGNDLFAPEPVHSLLGAQNRTAERMVGPEGGDEDFVNEIVRRVFDHLDLFEDDAALDLEVVVGEARRDDDVGQQAERGLHLLVEDVAVERGVLLAGEGIDVAAEDVDHLGDVARRPRGRPLEHQVLEKVRRPAVLLRLDGGTAAQVVAERHGADVGEGFDDDRQPRGEDVAADGLQVG